MKKTSLFVVDTDKEFQTLIGSLCPPDKIDVRFYSSAVEIFSLLRKEKPAVMFLCLDISDLNDFVMHDLLKKVNVDYSVPICLTYSRQSEEDLKKYEKLKYKAEGYLKKPVSKIELEPIVKKYLEIETPAVQESKVENVPGVDELDDDDFSDDNIDRLVRGEWVDVDAADDKKGDSTNEMRDRSASGTLAETEEELMIDDAEDVDLDIDLEFDSHLKAAELPVDHRDEGAAAASAKNKDLEVQVISLESQNEFLRTENKKLADNVTRLNADIEKKSEECRQLKLELDQKTVVLEALVKEKSDLTRETTEQNGHIQQLEEDKSVLQRQVNEIYNRLTDKEREMEAKSRDFEVELKKKSDEVLQETESRLSEEFKQREEQLTAEADQLKKEKDRIELELRTEIERLTEKTGQLESEREELKRREDSLNRTISTLAEEKVVLADKFDLYKKKMEELTQLLH
jgi:CheY-like chemotaxis protein